MKTRFSDAILNNKIKKPWCTYGTTMSSNGFGFIISETNTHVDVLYSENQLYPPDSWINKSCYIKRFDTLEEAVKRHQNNQSDFEYENISERYDDQMRMYFPTYFIMKKG